MNELPTENTPLLTKNLSDGGNAQVDPAQAPHGEEPRPESPPAARKGTPRVRKLRSRVKSTWQLQKNLDAEGLGVDYVDERGLAMFQPSEFACTGEEGDAQLIKYSEEVGTFKALFMVSGTVLTDKELWRTCAAYWVISISCATVAIFAQRSSLSTGSSSMKDISQSFERMAGYFEALIGFMLSMFVTTLFGRWWSIRKDGVGGLWGAIDDLMLLLSIQLPGKEHREVKERILRLGLLSHRLVYAQAQGLESREDLENFMDVGLLTIEELEILSKEPAKAQVVWVWIGQVIHQLALKDKLPFRDLVLPKLNELCVKARGSIGLIFAYTDTQVPFAYVHLLVLSIIFSNGLIAVKCGLAIGFTASDGSDINTASLIKMMVQVFHLVIIPFLYHAFVNMGLELANPLGFDYMCFPGYSYHVWMRNENLSFVSAGEKTPLHLLAV